MSNGDHDRLGYERHLCSTADLTNVTGSLYELDTDTFRNEVHALLAAEAGIPFTDAFVHNTEVTVAGTTFARTLEFISPYSVQFLPDSQWSVRLVGSNNNIFDVENGILVQNQVQVIPTNSAGLIVRETGVSGLTASESTQLNSINTNMNIITTLDFSSYVGWFHVRWVDDRD